MISFPKKFQFVSCEAIVELVEEVKPGKEKKGIAAPKSARYKYIFVPQVKSLTPSKKLDTIVEYSLDYLNRLESFQLLTVL